MPHEKAEYLYSNGWSFVDTLSLCDEVGAATLIQGREGVQTRSSASTRVETFSRVLMGIFQFLHTCINNRLALLSSTARHIKCTVLNELFCFYAYIMKIENSYSNDTTTMRSHFVCVSEGSKVKGLRITRFETLLSCFWVTNSEFMTLIDIFKNSIEMITSNVTIVAVDESVLRYNVRPEVRERRLLTDYIPAVYIPRNPHPNGLEVYIATTYVSSSSSPDKKSPWIIDLFPHLQQDDGPSAAFQHFFSRQNNKRIHWVADAAFGNEAIIDYIEEHGGVYTFSFASNRRSELWSALSADLGTGMWRCAADGEGHVASVQTTTPPGRPVTYHLAFSNGYNVITVPVSMGDASPLPQPQGTLVIPRYTIDQLSSLSLHQLKEICHTHTGTAPTTKPVCIRRILDNVSMTYVNASEIEHLEAVRLHSSAHPQSQVATVNSFYRSHFNYVDLLDRKWYSVDDSHIHQNWRTRYLLSLLPMMTINAWTLDNITTGETWKIWRSLCADELLSRHCDISFTDEN